MEISLTFLAKAPRGTRATVLLSEKKIEKHSVFLVSLEISEDLTVGI